MLKEIQQKMKVPKNQRNDFANFNYRSVEDIYAKFKEVQREIDCNLIVTDEMVLIGDRYYIQAIATLKVDGQVYSCSGWAREALSKTKMDDAQITGGASSYARKYALNGLFLLDDNKDIDSLDNSQKPLNDKQKLWASFSKEMLKNGIPKDAISKAKIKAGVKSLNDLNDKTIAEMKRLLEVV